MLFLAAGACLAGVAVINRGFYGFLFVAGLILAPLERGRPRLRP